VNDWVLAGFVALLPITALATVLQKRPLHAILARGMMGASAALIYGMMGAPDVALTEALMGTLLTVLLYLIAVRSAMTAKIGWLSGSSGEAIPARDACDKAFETLRTCCHRQGMEMELIEFERRTEMRKALLKGRIHGMIVALPGGDFPSESAPSMPSYRLMVNPDADWLHRLSSQCFERGGGEILVEVISEGQ
jgi:putative multicomponent Na+:H+ antiporter subunit B